MSKFDLSEFSSVLGSDLSMYVELARTAEATERYEDMCVVMKEFATRCAETHRELTVEERNLLSVAYKNVIGTRRASWRTLSSEKDCPASLTEIYKKQVEDELKETCLEVIGLLDKLTPDANEVEPKVFYLKMAGDYYRYLAESVQEEHGVKAADYYSRADELAKGLAETHPIRLGLALNFSVCYFEILKEPDKACQLAKQAFDDAISKLDKLEESDYKDSTLIMQLLRDNLTLWTSDQDNQNDQVEVHDLDEDEN